MTLSLDGYVEIPAGPFLLGASYDDIDPGLRARDLSQCLGLGAVLASTPPVWVDLPAFRMMARLVSNADYQRFWTYVHPELPDRPLVDHAEVWQMVWEQHGLGTVRVPASEPGGGAQVESYEACSNAIDAQVVSLGFECQRQVLGTQLVPGDPGFDQRSKAIVRLFGTLRRDLAASMSAAVELASGQRQAVGAGGDPAADAAQVLAMVEESADDPARSPLAVFLRRVARDAAAGQPPTVSRLFAPLWWPDDVAKALQGVGLFRTRMPFGELPVTGVSLYEAAAYAAWVRLLTGEPVGLPSEAEYEKAFGWDLAGSGLDPRRKHVFPWQGGCDLDFNHWFSREGERVEQLQARAAGYRSLLEDTARPLGTAKLYQGLGFGWQWTRERFSELERKYNRFELAALRRRQCEGRTVVEYRDCTDRSWRYAAVRGAPDQLGGPGTVTRRFALSPLRGSSDCGFRCVISPAGVH